MLECRWNKLDVCLCSTCDHFTSKVDEETCLECEWVYPQDLDSLEKYKEIEEDERLF